MEESRPATLNDLKIVIEALNGEGVPYLLIGGYALFAHGYHRTTVDIDILVPANRETGERVIRALMVLPDKAAKAVESSWFEEGATIRVADEIVVDIMFTACAETYDTLKSYGEVIEIEGVPVQTVSLEGLLLTKRGVRERDIADRLVLEKAMEAYRELKDEGLDR